jgi:hypothetical protein
MVAILVVGFLFFVFFYFTGTLFLQFGLKKANTFTQHVIHFWVGLLVVVSLFALAKAAFVTILVLIPLILLAFRKQLLEFGEVRLVPGLRFLLWSGVLYLFMFFLQVNFSWRVIESPQAFLPHIHPFSGERYVYSTILSFIHYEGAETVSMESVLHGFSGISLYHFIEFWLGSLFKTVLNAKSDLVLFYFVYPLFKTFTVLTIYAVFADKVDSRAALFVLLILIFCCTVLGFRWVVLPLGEIHLRDIILLPMLFLIGRSLYQRNYGAAMALLMVASVEYIILLPALFITVALFYNKYTKVHYLKLLAFLVLFGLVFLVIK